MADAAPIATARVEDPRYFLRGARNFPLAGFDPEPFLEQPRNTRLTASFMVPTMINMLTQVAKTQTVSTILAVEGHHLWWRPDADRTTRRSARDIGASFVQVYGLLRRGPASADVLDRLARNASDERTDSWKHRPRDHVRNHQRAGAHGTVAAGR